MTEKVSNSSAKPIPTSTLQQMTEDLEIIMYTYMQCTFPLTTLKNMIREARRGHEGHQLRVVYGEVEFIKAVTKMYNDHKDPFR